MPFNYRDKSKLADRLRGKSGEEILKELKSDLDSQGSRMFFDSPSWRSRHNNSAFPTGFPFDDDRNRINIRTYLDEIASRHPEFASQLRERCWGEELAEPSFARGGGLGAECRGREEVGSGAGGSEESGGEAAGPRQSLRNFGLRNTVPLGPQACGQQERPQRSMSAPPENGGPPKRFVSKCQIPVMSNPMQDSVQIKPDLAGKGPPEANLQKPNNAPNVRVIPIQVEGRDTPLVNTNIDTSTNFGAEAFPEPAFEGRLPRDFGSYQRHSPRFAHKERAATPPQFPSNLQHQPFAQPSQRFAPQQHFAPPDHQPFAQQQRPQKPPAPPPAHQHHQPPPPHQPHQPQQPQQPHQPQQPQQPHQPPPPPHHLGPKPPPPDETDSKPPKDPILKVQAIQKEVDHLMREVEAFQGTSRADKQYLMLDELLTRQLLLLDNIDTEGKDNVRQARKDTIRSIQRCISTLENKVPAAEGGEGAAEGQAEGEAEVKAEGKAEAGGEEGKGQGVGAGAGAGQPMEVDGMKEGTPAGGKDSRMEVDEADRQQESQQQEGRPDQPKEETKKDI